MLNKVILIGNVGSEPEVKDIQADLKVAKFSLATSESYKNKDGEKVVQTEWHNIVVWKGLAKVVELYVKKGSQLYIEGKIVTKSYEKDGQTRYTTEIIASELKLLGRKSETSQSSVSESSSNNSFANEPDGDDLPF